MDPPDGYRFRVNGDECLIEHQRTGMGCLKLFLGCWLAAWTLGCVTLIYQYCNAGKMENGDPIPLWFVLAFVIPWFIVAYLLLYLHFARKKFRLTNDALQVETRLFWMVWQMTLPRESISRIMQVQDGGEGDDSFPSWGLRLQSTSVVQTAWQRLSLVNHFGRHHRFRTLLARLPYEHSAWLAEVLEQWSGVPAELCENPGTKAEVEVAASIAGNKAAKK